VRTVQGTLTDHLGVVLRETPHLSVAGRTDAGVHARGQVVSFHTASALAPEVIQRALNGRLAPEVVVLEAAEAPEGFDARRSATAREYRYRLNAGPVPDAFDARFVWHHPGELSLTAMREAARALLGERDFASFCRRSTGTTFRDLQRLSIVRSASRVEFGVRANAFLHQMVRSLVGTLVAVGEGRVAPEAIPGILEARTRAAAGQVAPPHGLTLERVIYGSFDGLHRRR
jgi:tRNA pseudouridine38-40 synthase